TLLVGFSDDRRASAALADGHLADKPLSTGRLSEYPTDYVVGICIDGQERKRSVQGPGTEAQDQSPPNHHFTFRLQRAAGPYNIYSSPQTTVCAGMHCCKSNLLKRMQPNRLGRNRR